ncbi:ATP-binding protein [Streptomyces sp. NPDC014802]|uniref:ATP-binding protein n=1 Tax=unclassified Streptomyces TaxID=2593676 RepID=UPI003701422C
MSAEYATPLDVGDAPCERCGPCCPADVRAAVRSAVDRRCRDTGARFDEAALSDALLVASELTSNAILHGGGVTGFAVDLVAGGVRVSVSDRSRRLPVTEAPRDAAGRRRVGGRGWPIVCRLSRDVHVTDLPAGGKRITAEVPVY